MVVLQPLKHGRVGLRAVLKHHQQQRGSVRRALTFGQPDIQRNLHLAESLLTVSAQEFAQKWNFDVELGEPIAEGRYQWYSVNPTDGVSTTTTNHKSITSAFHPTTEPKGQCAITLDSKKSRGRNCGCCDLAHPCSGCVSRDSCTVKTSPPLVTSTDTAKSVLFDLQSSTKVKSGIFGDLSTNDADVVNSQLPVTKISCKFTSAACSRTNTPCAKSSSSTNTNKLSAGINTLIRYKKITLSTGTTSTTAGTAREAPIGTVGSTSDSTRTSTCDVTLRQTCITGKYYSKYNCMFAYNCLHHY